MTALPDEADKLSKSQAMEGLISIWTANTIKLCWTRWEALSSADTVKDILPHISKIP